MLPRVPRAEQDLYGTLVLSEELLSMRPSLFRYAGEAAENEDSILADILAVNDQVNRLIQKYRTNQESMINQVNNGGSEEETADLLGADLTDSTSTSEQPHSSKTTSIFEADDIFETNQKDALVNDFPDVPFIGFDRLLTPALPRRSNMKNTANPQPKLSPLSTLMDDDLFSNAPNHPQSFKSLKPTLNDLCSSLSTTNISDAFSTSILPESISLNSSTVQLASNPPSAVLEKQNINILLYCSTLSHITGMKTYILAIFNTHVETCHNIRLMMGTTNKKVSVHLQNGGNFDLLGVTPCRPIATVYRILCILPLSDVKEVDLDFSISYTQNYDRSITGNIILTLD